MCAGIDFCVGRRRGIPSIEQQTSSIAAPTFRFYVEQRGVLSHTHSLSRRERQFTATFRQKKTLLRGRFNVEQSSALSHTLSLSRSCSLSHAHSHTHSLFFTHTLSRRRRGKTTRRSSASGTRSTFKLYTLNPTPSNPTPQPYTLNPQPSTRNPKPETRNPKPEIRNPKPETRLSKHDTQNPNPKPET